ncbi:energy-coupling factor ABC transporter ATP-binding protein, partial [Enterococcus hirae]
TTGTPQAVFADNQLLEQTGLEKPFSGQLYDELVAPGFNVPLALKMNETKLEEWVCQLSSNQ